MKLKDLEAQKRVVESEIAERQEELRALDILIHRQRRRDGMPLDDSPSLILTNNNSNAARQSRVRGTLKTAKQAVLCFQGNFTRTALLIKIGELNPSLSGNISPEAMRSTMRTLIVENLIEPAGDDLLDELSGEVLYRRVYDLVDLID